VPQILALPILVVAVFGKGRKWDER
jgi:hypothetical protein